jgi:hypothetical protein
MKYLIGVLALLVGSSMAFSAETDKPSKDKIAKEMANPNTPLTSLKLQN